MSLITRCPACRTMFKVVQDQLKASQGWVRCGQCEQVFDATANLVQEPPALTTPLSAPPSSSTGQPSPAGALPSPPGAPQKTWEEEMMAAEFGDMPGHPDAPLEDLQLETPDAEAWREPRFTDDPDDVVSMAASRPEPGPRQTGSGFSAPASSMPRAHEAAMLSEPPAAQEPLSAMSGDVREPEDGLSFMRRSRWQHPAVRTVLFLLCCVLSLGLVLQVARHERDRIVAHEPQLRSWLHVMCEQLDCTVEPLRQIDSVVIDGSAFSKIRDELYQLNLTLRNKAPVDMALPAVELVLTDVQDQVLIRRVLQPQELLGTGAGVAQDGVRLQGAGRLIRATSEFQATVQMEVKNGNGASGSRNAGPGLEGRVAGYRLLAFYP